MASQRLRAVWNGGREASRFVLGNYLVSGVVKSFYRGYREHLENEVEPREVAADLINECEHIFITGFDIGVEPLSDSERQDVIEHVVGDVELLKHEAYPIIADYLFEDRDRYERSTYLCLAFCWEMSRVETDSGGQFGDERADFRYEVREIVSEFNFSDPGEEEEWFLQRYDQLRNLVSADDLDRGSAGNEEQRDLETVYWDFAYTYIPLQHPEYNEKDKNEKERLRSKVIQLVHDAELNTGSASRNLLAIIRDEEERIRDEFEQRQAYMVFSQSLSDDNRKEFKDALETKFPYFVDIGNKSYHTPSEGRQTIFLTQHIVYPVSEYRNLEDFYERGISQIVPEGRFVAIMKINTSEYYLPDDEEDLLAEAENPSYVENSISALDFLQTEHPPEDITSRAIDNLLGDEIEVKEMLRSLRIDVLIPSITTTEQDVIREQREQIEAKFEIQDVFDWRKKNPLEVAEYIYHCDKKTDNSPEEWEKRTDVLVERAENWYRATQSIS